MADLTAGNASLGSVRADYMAQTRRKRFYSGILLAVFALLMIGGFQTAQSRNAGGFWSGLPQVFDFPASVVREFWERIDRFPGNLIDFFPALIETINIAAVSTLLGAALGLLLSLLSTRGLAPFPRLIPVFRRSMDLMRAVPEIVIALVLIYIMGAARCPRWSPSPSTPQAPWASCFPKCPRMPT